MDALLLELTEIIKNSLDSDYKIYIGNMGEKDINTVVIGTYASIDPDSEFNDTLSIEYVNVLLNMHTYTGSSGVHDGFKHLGMIREHLSKINNYVYDNGEHGIMRVNMIGNVNYLGTNKFNIPLFSMSFRISYK